MTTYLRWDIRTEFSRTAEPRTAEDTLVHLRAGTDKPDTITVSITGAANLTVPRSFLSGTTAGLAVCRRDGDELRAWTWDGLVTIEGTYSGRTFALWISTTILQGFLQQLDEHTASAGVTR